MTKRVRWVMTMLGYVVLASVTATRGDAQDLAVAPSLEQPSVVKSMEFDRPCGDEPAVGERKPVVVPKSDPAHPIRRPDYPVLSRRLGEEGRVIVNLRVNEAGEVAAARVHTSSGHPALDAAALQATRDWKLKPGTVAGTPTCMWHRFAVNFALKDETDPLPQPSALAQQLTPKLLGLDDIGVWLSTDAASSTASERALMRAVVNGVAQSKWVAPLRDYVGALLTAQLSPEEQTRLLQVYAQPPNERRYILDEGLRKEILPVQRAVAYMVTCNVRALDAASKELDIDELIAGDAFTPRYASEIPQFIDRTITFCDCAIRKPAGMKADEQETAEAMKARCGAVPEL